MISSWPRLCASDHESDLLTAFLGTAIEPENVGDGVWRNGCHAFFTGKSHCGMESVAVMKKVRQLMTCVGTTIHDP